MMEDRKKERRGKKKYIVNHSLVTHPFSGSMSCSGISASFCHLKVNDSPFEADFIWQS